MTKMQTALLFLFSAVVLVYASAAQPEMMSTGSNPSWETYVNSRYGYSFHYPVNWYLEESTELITTVRPWKREAHQYSNPITDLTVTVYPTPESWERIRSDMDKGHFIEKRDFTIGGQPAQEMTELAEKGLSYTHIFIEKNGSLFAITYSNDSPELPVMNQIVDSFKFTS